MPPYRMDVTTDHYPIFFLLLSEFIIKMTHDKLAYNKKDWINWKQSH